MARNKGLGRGLSALIGEVAASNPANGVNPGATAIEVPIERVRPSRFQPRKEFPNKELEELAESIRRHGVLQPIVVRVIEDGYEIIAGERRVRAAKMVGLATVPAWSREATDQEMTALALIENVQREDLNPLEEAEAYQRLARELDWTQDEIADQVGKARSHVANYLRLLQLDARIQEWIREKRLTMAHAKVLLSVEDEAFRLALAESAVAENLTVRELDQRRLRPPVARLSPRPELDVHMRQVEEGLRRALGAGVRVRGDGQKGRIEIRYRSLEELERLIEILANAEAGPESFPV